MISIYLIKFGEIIKSKYLNEIVPRKEKQKTPWLDKGISLRSGKDKEKLLIRHGKHVLLLLTITIY